MANPINRTLVADTELVLTLDDNYGKVRVTVIANQAVIYTNTKDVAIGAVSGNMDGNDPIPAVLCSVTLNAETSGTPTKVRLRSLGTPTVSVRGL